MLLYKTKYFKNLSAVCLVKEVSKCKETFAQASREANRSVCNDVQLRLMYADKKRNWNKLRIKCTITFYIFHFNPLLASAHPVWNGKIRI